MAVPVIDVWAQPAPLGAFTSSIFAPLVQRARAAERLALAAEPERIVSAMDEAGIEKCLLCAWCLQDGWMITNRQVADMVKAFRDRFIGVASVRLGDAAASDELRAAVIDDGFRALRVIPWVWNKPPNDPVYWPLFETCIELGIPFCTQVGHTGPRMPSEPGRPIPYLDEVALKFPDLKIVAGHIGYPWTDEMIALAWKHDNVFIDTSAYLPRYYPPQLVTFMRSYGQDKVLFGTNFPMLAFDDCVSQTSLLNLPKEVEEKFLAGNARRVFGIE